MKKDARSFWEAADSDRVFGMAVIILVFIILIVASNASAATWL